MASQWSHVLSVAELQAHYALTASIDPAFASQERKFYETRTTNQLKALAAQAFECNSPTGYQLAKSYLAQGTAS